MKKIIKLTENDLMRIVKRVIKESYDDTIAKIQKELIKKGYDLGDYGPNGDGVDGIMGPLTKKAYEKEFKKPYDDKDDENDDEKNKESDDDKSISSKVGDYGKITLPKSKSASLLIVFGGIPVGGRQSGEYMWDYLEKLKSKYIIFVANNHNVNGLMSYKSVLDYLDKLGVEPTSQVLYLFSGGYKPGMDVLKSNSGSFKEVLLVDIWMKSSYISDFYKDYTSSNSSKVKYYYTSFGANNNSARDFISKKASISKLQPGGSMTDHMKTNNLAVSSL